MNRKIPDDTASSMPTRGFSYAKVKKLISEVQFPGIRIELGIILNKSWGFSISDTPILVLFIGTEIPKNPGIQPKYHQKFIIKSKKMNKSVKFRDAL